MADLSEAEQRQMFNIVNAAGVAVREVYPPAADSPHGNVDAFKALFADIRKMAEAQNK